MSPSLGGTRRPHEPDRIEYRCFGVGLAERRIDDKIPVRASAPLLAVLKIAM